jgi:hypothetical protein
MASSRSRTRWASALVALFFGLATHAANICDPTIGTQCQKVNPLGSGQVNEGPSSRVTYYATFSGATTTAAWAMVIESEAARGFKVSKVCVTYSPGATAAGTIITTTVRRTTAASSGGTVLTPDGTGVAAVTKAVQASSSWAGLSRAGAVTVNGAGTTFDQWQFSQMVVNTAAQPLAWPCREFGLNGEQLPTIDAGTSNGFAVTVSAGGAGSLATGAISVTFITET